MYAKDSRQRMAQRAVRRWWRRRGSDARGRGRGGRGALDVPAVHQQARLQLLYVRDEHGCFDRPSSATSFVLRAVRRASPPSAPLLPTTTSWPATPHSLWRTTGTGTTASRATGLRRGSSGLFRFRWTLDLYPGRVRIADRRDTPGPWRRTPAGRRRRRRATRFCGDHRVFLPAAELE